MSEQNKALAKHWFEEVWNQGRESTIDDLIAEEDKVAIRWTCTMVHNGEGLGFPATGKNVAFPGSSFIACRDGQITQGWNFMDLTKMTQQLQSS